MLPWSAWASPSSCPMQLVLDARLVGQTAERSIASQIEFWARVGRAVEPVLRASRSSG